MGSDLTETARRAMGMSGADIAAAVRSARAKARNARRNLTLEDLTATISEIRPPLSPALLKLVAVHEAGHAIASVATGRAMLKSVEICGSGGVTKASIARDRQDRAALEDELVIDLSGRAAEFLVFGRVSSGAGGAPDSDLARATLLAAAIEGSWGLGDTLIWRGPEMGIVKTLQHDAALRRRVEAHLRRAEARAVRILEQNRYVLENLAGALMDAGILTEPELTVFAGQIVRADGSSLEMPCNDDPEVRVA
jgi:ATP-dependent Zn protease